MSYLFVVLATTLLLALLKVSGSPATTWGWVAFPILGSLVMWLLFIGSVTTVGLIWPPKGAGSYVPFTPDVSPFEVLKVYPTYDEYVAKVLRADRRIDYNEVNSFANMERKEEYYRKALALELATLAHDTPGFIEWEKRGETLIGELKILVRNEHA